MHGVGQREFWALLRDCGVTDSKRLQRCGQLRGAAVDAARRGSCSRRCMACCGAAWLSTSSTWSPPETFLPRAASGACAPRSSVTGRAARQPRCALASQPALPRWLRARAYPPGHGALLLRAAVAAPEAAGGGAHSAARSAQRAVALPGRGAQAGGAPRAALAPRCCAPVRDPRARQVQRIFAAHRVALWRIFKHYARFRDPRQRMAPGEQPTLTLMGLTQLLRDCACAWARLTARADRSRAGARDRQAAVSLPHHRIGATDHGQRADGQPRAAAGRGLGSGAGRCAGRHSPVAARAHEPTHMHRRRFSHAGERRGSHAAPTVCGSRRGTRCCRRVRWIGRRSPKCSGRCGGDDDASSGTR